ncbi:MAG: TfoX/Sxy family protein [Thermoleophilaceae bacterium]
MRVNQSRALSSPRRQRDRVRVDPEETDALLAKPGVRPLEMRGRSLDGWVRVAADGVRTKHQLEPWVQRGVSYARSLPPKG